MKAFDYFGQNINFLIHNQVKYKTNLGLFFTILSLVSIGIVCFLFGKDFYLKENPKIFSENILTNQYRRVNITPSNFIFTIRIEDASGNILSDYENYFKLLIQYKNVVYNNQSQAFIEKINYLDNKPCRKELVPNVSFYNERNLTEWICFDFPMNGFDIGGSWSGLFVDYFEIKLMNKNNKLYKNADTESNTSDEYEYLNNTEIYNLLLSKEIYISMYYQVFYFVPNNLENAFNIKYNNYYSQISYNSEKIDRVFFKSFFFEDDNGWIFKNIQNNELIGFYERDFEVKMKDKSEIDNNKINSYYSLNIYYSSNYEKFHRSYMKIQELAALVGGFMKMVIFCIEVLLFSYTKFEMYKYLISKTIDYSDNNKSNQKTISHVNPIANLNNQVINEDNNKSKSEISIVGNCKSISKFQNNLIGNCQKESSKTHNFMKEIVDNHNINSIYNSIKEDEDDKIKVSYISYMFGFINKNHSYKIFNNLKNYFNEQLDIIKLITNYNYIKIIKDGILNKNQLLGIRICNKLKINNIEEENTIDYDSFQKMFHYYSNNQTHVYTEDSDNDENNNNNINSNDIKINKVIINNMVNSMKSIIKPK